MATARPHQMDKPCALRPPLPPLARQPAKLVRPKSCSLPQNHSLKSYRWGAHYRAATAVALSAATVATAKVPVVVRATWVWQRCTRWFRKGPRRNPLCRPNLTR